MGKSGDLKAGDWCLWRSPPGGRQAGRTPVVRLGRLLSENKGPARILRTDCTLVGGDSGGPLFDMHGRSSASTVRIGGSLTANMHVPVDTYRDTWDGCQGARIGAQGLGGKADRLSRRGS